MYSGRRVRHTTNLLDILKADMKHGEMSLRNINDLELLRSAAADKARWKERLITALIICINNVLILCCRNQFNNNNNNVTSLIQPMDQGVVESIKHQYWKMILEKLVLPDDDGTSIIDIAKIINMLTVSKMIAASWNEIKQKTLRLPWGKESLFGE